MMNYMDDSPLKEVMNVLVLLHFIHLVFSRTLYNRNGMISRNHDWIWLMDACIYSLVIANYVQSELHSPDIC